MPDPSEQNAPNPDHPGLQAQVTRVVVSRKRFESVPRKRAVYIGLYVFSFILWALLAFVYMRVAAESVEQSAPSSDSLTSDSADPSELDPAEQAQLEVLTLPTWARAIRIFTGVCLGAFYIPFINVLRIMGYPWVAVLAFCVFALAPIPGLLVVAYMDTRIAKAWNQAELTLLDAAAPGSEG